MSSTILTTVKIPLLVGITSGACCVCVCILWLKFPAVVPLWVFMAIGFVGAVVFTVCQVVVALRVARRFAPAGPLAVDIRNLPWRTLITIGATVVFCNGLVLFLTDLKPKAVWAVATSLAVLVSWLVARRITKRRDGDQTNGR